MKAIVVREFGAPEVMKVEDVPTPEPGGDEVLVRIMAAGVNPVDTYLRSGSYANPPKLPYTPGKDGSGVVEKVGKHVRDLEPGDRVYTADSISGTYAEFALCRRSQLGRLPDRVSFEEGACIWTPYATSYRALFQKAAAVAGETVLVHGASGGVGLAAVQWAVNAGLKVFGTASSDEGKKLVLDAGAKRVVDHTDPGHLQRIKELSGDKGVDIILEMLANENLQRDFEALAMFGRIVVVGNRGSLEFNPRAAMGKDATIYGMVLFNAPRNELDEIHSAIYAGLESGFLKPFVRTAMPLAEAPRAHHEIIENKALGKIVLAT
jgi:NADPH2:quinone reductase